MKIYRYWVKSEGTLQVSGSLQKCVVFGSSNLSHEDAVSNAKEKIALIQSRINHSTRKDENYEVSIREEFLEEIIPGNIVTRNRYGAEVLNSETVLFADIDLADLPKRKNPGVLMRLFGAKEESPADFQERIQNLIFGMIRQEWTENGTVRVYRTHSGFRMLFAGFNIDAGSVECTRLLKSVRSDWLYTSLCSRQRCCRARLTPKPSRIAMKGRRFKYPYEESESAENGIWLNEYTQKSQNYAVCKLLRTFGKSPSEADQKVINYHDLRCRAEEKLPLA
jgi:hypothetical protein